ncbi:uncharacterized protein LOC133970635 isoform X2 [Platichthys flesus]|uniref:uncharacterized protein LOC133970635 isoform X2 n=1 Tax=Platichthys flesus TaxID=8260 RepID=UPI002DBD1974|nr:uncharacterized protein LOC133970635 isoform X2 [Platichthys flesus]
MGRLDDAAKHKVVELRKAGLSFRKIKAVLELENIKVSAQAIYLFLREFQGRPPGRVRPVEGGGSTTNVAHMQAQAATTQDSWSNAHLHNLLRKASHHAGFTAAADFAKQTSTNPEACGKPPGVTSLAQNSQQGGPQCNAPQAVMGAVPSTPTGAGAFMRKRVSPSPASNSVLAARKRLLDKALSHRMKSFQQVASLLKRDHPSVQGSTISSAMPQLTETYDLTTEKTVIEGQSGGSGPPKRFLTQRPGLSVRSPHPPPRVGIRLPNRLGAPFTSSAPGGSVIRLQITAGQGAPHSEQNLQQAAQDTGGKGGLQDQIQTLGSEVRGLGLAVKMLVEQQCRLEREQVQQTHIQKQILSTLQSLSLKLGPCSSSQQQHNKTPSPSASTSFSQDNFSFSRGTYTQCSQTQPSYNSLESLDNVEAFKLPGLSPTSMNGFPPCSNAENLPLTHTPPQTQPYAAAYAQQTSQNLMAPYTQSYPSTFTQTHSQSFRISESKSSDFPSSCSARSLQSCSVSTQPLVNSSHAAQDQRLNVVKVEGP